jgi:hypothetical protein
MAESIPGSDAPRRTTGEIPLSWAVPAEAVSEDTSTDGSRSTLIATAGVVVVLVLAAVIMRVNQGAPTTTTATAAATPTTTTTTTPETTTAPALAAPPLPEPPAEAVAAATPPEAAPPEAATTTTTTEAAPDATPAVTTIEQKKAKALVFAARQSAKDGEDEKATRLAELAVQTDPSCAGCWKTVALLRMRAGDKAGAAVAKARAAQAEDAAPPVPAPNRKPSQ